MNKKIVVNIPDTISAYVNKLFFEYNALKDLILYLSSNDGVDTKYIDKYTEDFKNKYSELEIAKSNADKDYRPDNLEDNYSYYFDFDNSAIVYTVNDNEK